MEILLLGKCYRCINGKIIREMGNGIWRVFYRNIFLGFFDEKYLRNKQQG